MSAYTAKPDLFDGSVAKWSFDILLKPSNTQAIVALARREGASAPTSAL